MFAEFTLTRKTVPGLVALGLLGTTVMTTAMLVPQPGFAKAETLLPLWLIPPEALRRLWRR
ncbi:MAG: hypothetical protein U1E15_10850 [Hyphomicrobiales bacterium]